MQKIVIFGASGGTGRLLVERALQSGDQVTAFIRQASSFPVPHGRLRLAVGDIRDEAAVSAAITGQDVVLSALGPSRKNEPVCADGSERILAGMQAHQVRRLVALSAYGASESRHGLYSLVTWLLLRNKMQDKERMEVLIRASPVDWTLVRPPALTDGPGIGTYRAGVTLPIKVTSNISRADLAAFMLREARERKYLHEAPAIMAWKPAGAG